MNNNYAGRVARLSQHSQDWLLSAVDPFHDFEHPIEGAPDHAVSRSYTRKFTQSGTVGVAAADQSILIRFNGYHGSGDANFYASGTNNLLEVSPLEVGKTFAPIQVFRAAVGSTNSMASYNAGTSNSQLKFYTCQVGGVPSRLCSLGIEVTDITPALYKKGTIYACHANGEVQNGHYICNSSLVVSAATVGFVRKPVSPFSAPQIANMPGSYVGQAAKGLYLQARLNVIQPPRQTSDVSSDASATKGSRNEHPVLTEPGATTPSDARTVFFYPTCNAGDDIAGNVSWTAFDHRTSWSDSGFTPFSILIDSVAAESLFKIVVKATVEYFPQVTHPFECGLATYSPPYDPLAFALYHEIMRQIPAGVPVSMNPGGEYFRMLVAAAKRVGYALQSASPYIGMALSTVGDATGDPRVKAVAKLVTALGARPRSNPPRASKSVGKKSK